MVAKLSPYSWKKLAPSLRHVEIVNGVRMKFTRTNFLSKTVFTAVTCVCLAFTHVSSAFCQRPQDYKGAFELPEIVRFADLPRRMYLEPEFVLPVHTRFTETSVVEFLIRILHSPPDDEMLVEAIRSVEKIHQHEYADVLGAGELLHNHLLESKKDIVRQSAASALASLGRRESAAAVAACCIPRFESLCLNVEPAFAKWGDDALRETWHRRISSPDNYPAALVPLACNGLTQLNDVNAVTSLQVILDTTTNRFSDRHAAARAIGALVPPTAVTFAETHFDGTLPEKLLACSLLEHCESERGFFLLSQMCDDDSAAVASRAWETVFELKPAELVSRIGAGAAHTDSNIRKTAIQVLGDFPTVERCTALQKLMADLHISVRNLARSKLYELAVEDVQWKSRILKDVGSVLRDPTSSWESLEQSLILAGELRHFDWQSDAVRLLDHPRAEVYVTAAWLLHLMPPSSLSEEIGESIARRYPATPEMNHAHQLTFLFQCAGVLNIEATQPLCEKQFTKGGPIEMRGAALWALGKMNAGTPDPGLVKKFLGRIFDDSAMDPEVFLVRRMSVLALVSMNAKSTVPEIRRARDTYGKDTLFGEATRWAFPQLGADPLPGLKSYRLPWADFPIGPL